MNKLEQAARQVLQHWASSEDLAGAITDLRKALAEQAEQEPVAEAIAAEARLHRAVRAVASQAGESAEDTIEWLCNGGMAQLFECHFSGKNRESLCEDEGCPHRGVPHICIEKQAEQEPVAWALTSENGEVLDCISHTYKVTQPCTVDYDKPLYAAPVRTKDLTDDEIEDVCCRLWSGGWRKKAMNDFARAVITKFKEKNK